MLKPKALARVLSSGNTNGVISTLLLNADGVLLAFAGAPDTNATVTAAIASSLFQLYDGKGGQDTFNGDRLHTVIVECELGHMAVAKTGNLLICMCAKQDANLGMLKIKTESMADYLKESLAQLEL